MKTGGASQACQRLDAPCLAFTRRPLTPLPPLGSFDLIVARRITFHSNIKDGKGLLGEDRLWTADEWGALLDDLASRRRPGGELFLSFNFRAGDASRHAGYHAELDRMLRSSGVVALEYGVYRGRPHRQPHG